MSFFLGSLPLHPAFVHIPLGIIFILPIITILMFLFYKKELLKQRGFLLVSALHLILSGTAYIAMEFGEDEEHKVEKVVAEQFIEEHEDSAETLSAASVAVLIVSIIVVFLPTPGLFRLGITSLVTLQFVLVYLGITTGHTGGKLVYTHGAAEVYTAEKDNTLTPPSPDVDTATQDEDDD